MSTIFDSTCLGSCSPPQIVNMNMPFTDISTLHIYGNCNEYDRNGIQYSYSLDGVCWSCYMSYEEALSNTAVIDSDFYVRAKISAPICKITIDENGDENVTTEYSTQLASGFNFSSCTPSGSSNTYNPYANMDGAISLAQGLSDTVSCMFGIPIYYFKLSPNAGSRDVTFKEYALMNVEAVKQLKLIIADGTMPSSKPEFSDFGLDWQTDWETEITKSSFATAFGMNTQPMEGDLIYIPMMKRMWMVNGAYEEKKDSLMWVATTFKVALVKYQEKGSVDLGFSEEIVNTFVKNKYDDLFGEDDRQTYDSGEKSVEPTKYAANRLYPVFESDATRKYVSCDTVEITPNNIYFKGVLISDNKYDFITNAEVSQITYQKQYCGEEASMSFIIYPHVVDSFRGPIISIGNIQVIAEQDMNVCTLYLNVEKECRVQITNNNAWFIVLRWSKCMNTLDMAAYKYVHDEHIPMYKLAPNHYWFDMDNVVSSYVGKHNVELIVTNKEEVSLYNFYGWITNFKLFDSYNDNLSELLQMYPTHQHLMINDTARKLVGLPGVALR